MTIKPNHKSFLRHSRQVPAWFVLTFLAFLSAVGPRAYAQSGGPGTDQGVVKSIDDSVLEIRNSAGNSVTYRETDQTKWLNSRGQQIDAGDVVGKNVEVRFRFVTGGTEALSVRITSSSSRSEESSAHASRAKNSGEMWGFVKNIDDAVLELRNASGNTFTFSETDQTKWLNKRGGTIDAGDTVGKWVEITFRSTGEAREAMSVQLR